jgi:hypothetical protein
MRTILAFPPIFLLLPFSSFNQPNGDPILWGSKEITWEDFKGKPDPSRRSAATSLSTMEIEIKTSENHRAQALVRAFFQTNRSFARYKDPTLLQHERGHFDIAELYARKLRLELSTRSYPSSTYRHEVMKLYDQLNEQMDQYQDKYDEETDFSMALDQQKKWYVSIQEELKKLEAYSNTLVTLKLDSTR